MKINVNNYQKRFLPREYKVQQWSHLKLILEGFVLYKIQQHYDAISSMGLKHWFSRMKYVTEHTQHLPTNQRMPALPNKLHLLKALPTLHTEPPPSYTRWDIPHVGEEGVARAGWRSGSVLFLVHGGRDGSFGRLWARSWVLFIRKFSGYCWIKI